jgi:hypothetical protein
MDRGADDSILNVDGLTCYEGLGEVRDIYHNAFTEVIIIILNTISSFCGYY